MYNTYGQTPPSPLRPVREVIKVAAAQGYNPIVVWLLIADTSSLLLLAIIIVHRERLTSNLPPRPALVYRLILFQGPSPEGKRVQMPSDICARDGGHCALEEQRRKEKSAQKRCRSPQRLRLCLFRTEDGEGAGTYWGRRGSVGAARAREGVDG